MKANTLAPVMARWPARAGNPAPASPSAPTASKVAGVLEFVFDPMRLLMFALTILTVSRVHQHYPLLAKLRPALLLTIGAAAHAWIHPKYLTKANVLKLWPMRRVAMLAVLACCSAAFGISLGHSARFILDSYGKTLMYAFVLMLSIRNAKDLYTFVWAYSISSGILAFFAMFVFKMSKVSDNAVMRLNDLYTYDSNDLGVVLLVGLSLTLLLLQVTTDAKRRIPLVLILVGVVASLARSGSRGAFLGLVAVAGGALFLVNAIPAARRIMILLSALIALVVFAPAGYWAQMSTIIEPKDDYNLTSKDGRKEIIKRGLGYVAMYPVFGLGINNFSRAECTISAGKVTREGQGAKCIAPHNSYVQSGAEMGVPAFLVWVSMVWGGIFAMLKLRKRLPNAWRRGTETERFLYSSCTYFALALIGFSVSAFFVSFAWADIVYILAVFMSGLYVAVREHKATVWSAQQGRTGAMPAMPRRKRGWRTAPAPHIANAALTSGS